MFQACFPYTSLGPVVPMKSHFSQEMKDITSSARSEIVEYAIVCPSLPKSSSHTLGFSWGLDPLGDIFGT